jgi:Glycosyl hydrolase family 20, catalytic domain
VLVLEVDYNFQFASHPEICQGTLTKADAREVAAVCRAHGIRVIPLLNCLGHQSWSKKTFTLLSKHPEFDETPNIPLDNPDIYCRSWCPLHPDVNPLVFDLMDELLDAFEAKALHVGMDEVFLIASEQCPRCRGRSPAELFARAVNDYHRHLVDEKGVEMLMWADRLLNAKETGYGEWEAAANGTDPAVDMVPKDIIMCDWHYEVRDRYPSLRLFQDKGFRVWPCPWRNPKAAQLFLDAAKQNATDRMLGVLCTGWDTGGGGSLLAKVLFNEAKPGEAEDVKTASGVAQVLQLAMEAFSG